MGGPYHVSEELWKIAPTYCAALFLHKVDLLGAPASLSDPNGTITFAKYGNTVYGITCNHVVQELRKLQAEDPKSFYCFQTVHKRFSAIYDRFSQPLADIGSAGVRPDIAIRVINPELVKVMEKSPILLDGTDHPGPETLTHAIIAGFPKSAMYEVKDSIGTQIAMGRTQALADIVWVGPGSIKLRSHFNEVPVVSKFGGFSGGPIFWTDGDAYGLLGIIIEAHTMPEDDGLVLQLYGELVSESRFAYWLNHLPPIS